MVEILTFELSASIFLCIFVRYSISEFDSSLFRFVSKEFLMGFSIVPRLICSRSLKILSRISAVAFLVNVMQVISEKFISRYFSKMVIYSIESRKVLPQPAEAEISLFSRNIYVQSANLRITRFIR